MLRHRARVYTRKCGELQVKMQSRRKAMTQNETPDIAVSAQEFFENAISEAMSETGTHTTVQVRTYLTQLLKQYILTENLFDETDSSGRKTRDTLAELYLRAHAVDLPERFELLKKLGDSSLYISGFFSDSLQRKLVDVDYYMEMGGVAYADLAGVSREQSNGQMFREFSVRFVEFVEVLNVIAQKSQVQNENNILRLFDLYSQTGSQVFREKLLQKGVFAFPNSDIKKQKN